MRGGIRKRGEAIALAIITAIIVYGSLYPFQFRQPALSIGTVSYLLSTWRDWDRRGDLLANILLYMPFGLLAARSLPDRLSRSSRIGLVLLGGTLLSAAMELLQFNDVGRTTSMGDVYANTIGSLLGAAAGIALGGSFRWPLVRELGENLAPATLIAAWLGYRLYPYVPTINLHKYWHTIRPLIHAPSLPAGELAGFAIIWLCLASVVEQIFGFRRWLLLFPALVGAEVAGRIMMLRTSLEPSDIVGALVAWSVWLVLLRWMPGRMTLLAVLFPGLVVIGRLEPLRFGPARSYDWVPFLPLMRASTPAAVQSFCQKVLLFGGAIWLLDRAGFGPKAATLLTTAVLLVTSLVQVYLPDRSASVTDPVMALLIGGIFALLSGHSLRGRTPSAGAVSSRHTLHAKD
jgi:VanZ family protein